MENLNAITSFLAQVWQVMTIEHPVLGIPFSVIYLGSFAVGFGIMILKPLLGIGTGVVTDVSSSTKRIRERRIKNKRTRYNESYEKWASDRERQTAFARRYYEGRK